MRNALAMVRALRRSIRADQPSLAYVDERLREIEDAIGGSAACPRGGRGGDRSYSGPETGMDRGLSHVDSAAPSEAAK